MYTKFILVLLFVLSVGKSVQAQSCNCCSAPLESPTNLIFSQVEGTRITASFAAAAGADGYLIVKSSSASIKFFPEKFTTYPNGSAFGSGVVFSNTSNTNFTVTGLSFLTQYYFHIYAYKNCAEGIRYHQGNALLGNVTTNTLCSAPTVQPTNLAFGSSTTSTISGSFTSSGASEYLVVMSTSATLSATPVNGTAYAVNDALGGGVVVSRNNATTFSASGLNAGTTYYFFVFAATNNLNGCSGGPIFLTASPLTGSNATQLPPCTAPSAPATALSFSGVTTTTITGTFTPAPGATQLVLMSTSPSLSQQPVSGTTYAAGATLGNATVIHNNGSSFTATSLIANTTYYFYLYSFNNTGCTGGPAYFIANPLTSSQATLLPACVAPSAQATALNLQTLSSTSLSGSFTLSSASGHLILMSTSASLSQQPVNGTTYIEGNALGNATIMSTSGSSFTATALNSNTVYYFFVYAFNNTSCTGGPAYLISNPLSGSQTTQLPPCTIPSGQATNLTFSNITYNSISGSFTPISGAQHLILMTTTSNLSQQPVDGVSYGGGSTLGNATVLTNTGNTFTATGLSGNTLYYFHILSYNNTLCSGGPKYRTSLPLIGNQETISPPVAALNFYFGNLHSHSTYSDGNADDITKTPADDYNFAKTAMCFDFLGIAEHNHAEAGMSINNWQPGLNQAAAATTNDFVALYGMEWGTITTGGHVVVYGIDSLIGWEPNNYQIFVAKGDYTGTSGLFKILNRNGNAFGYLAHPNSSDYNNLVTNSYDSVFDRVVVGSAVESGPAFSTATTYDDFPAAMGYLTYYRNMLSKGYKVGPTIDHDNHNMTFGKTATSRLVILSTSLNKQQLLTSMKQRRFYATQDCTAKITFSIGTNAMGSVITQSGAPVINVSSITNSPVSSLRVMFGVPGSGSNATQLTSTSNGSLTFTDTGLTSGNTRYYYLDITEADGKRIITAPIWYTRQ